MNKEMQTNLWNVWWLAIRPKTLFAAVSGVVVGTALAWSHGAFRPLVALAALACAILLQVGSNLANDVFDYERGADTQERLGPTRVTQTGLLSAQQVKAGMWMTFGLAACVGLYLAWVGGWPIILIGLAAIVAAISYTGGPFAFGYHGLGEVFVFIFFGPVAVVGTYFLQAKAISPAAWWMSVPIGLIVTAILIVNNLRDISSDRAAGKRTLAVRMGEARSRGLYVACMAGAHLVLAALVLLGIIPVGGLAALLSLPVAWRATRIVLLQEGRALNGALAGTSQTAFFFSLLFFIGLLLG